MIGRTNVGGGAGLNFKVVGNPQPETAKDNTIWVNTDAKITSWVFSATHPETAEEGMVWISTGKSSSVEFNALKKNGITVYPLYSKQYVNGAWVDKTAKIYQNGAWVDWIMHLYTPGNEHTDKTGGWVAKALPAGNASTALPTITRNSDDIRFALSGTGGKSGVCYLKNKIVLSGRKTVRFYGHTNNTPRDTIRLRIWSAIGATSDNNVAASTSLFEKPNFDATPVTLDVSALSGEYYIGVQLIGYEGSQPVLTITQIEVE